MFDPKIPLTKALPTVTEPPVKLPVVKTLEEIVSAIWLTLSKRTPND
jgi:hypothetical protein